MKLILTILYALAILAVELFAILLAWSIIKPLDGYMMIPRPIGILCLLLAVCGPAFAVSAYLRAERASLHSA